MAGSNTNPGTPSNDERSEQAPGVRTEAEVKADEEAAQAAAADAAPAGATGNPTVTTDVPDEVDDDKLVHYVRKSDGEVQSVNVGSLAHEILESDGEWRKTTLSKARAADKKRASA